MDRLTIPDESIEGGMRRSVVDARAVKEQAMGIYWRLKAYEDTGMEPENIKVLRNNFEALSISCNEMLDRIDDLDSKGNISDIYTIEHCPFCGAEKEILEYDVEHCIVACNECGRNFRVRENLY